MFSKPCIHGMQVDRRTFSDPSKLVGGMSVVPANHDQPSSHVIFQTQLINAKGAQVNCATSDFPPSRTTMFSEP